MPIKLPKGFARRRRSSGNILDSFDEQSPSPTSQEPSFRVLARHNTDTNVFDDNPVASQLKRRTAVRPTPSGRPPSRPSSQPLFPRAPSYDDGSEGSNRGSGNTYNSVSTANRDSYASTEPSSVESRSREDLRQNKSTYEPIAPYHSDAMEQDNSLKDSLPRDRSFSFKAAARTFSFGTKPKAANGGDANDLQGRDRSATQSSYASTATPPKLDFGNTMALADKGFGSEFGDLLAKRKSTIMEDPSESVSTSRTNSEPTLLSKGKGRSNWAADALNRSVTDYRDEERRLMESPGPGRTHSPFAPPPLPSHSQFMLDAVNASRYLEKDLSQPFTSTSTEYPLRSRGDGPPPSRIYSRPAEPTAVTGLYTRKAVDGAALEGSVRRSALGTDDEPLFDNIRQPTFQQQQRSASPMVSKAATKVMTPGEFEEYKNRINGERVDDDAKSDISDGSVPEDDEDETERNRQMAKQRRKQEAQLAVYRQQMMKVTGEQPSELPSNISRSGLSRVAQAAPRLPGGNKTPGTFGSQVSVQGNGQHNTEEDEDDDVPLGVLQAHGFPNKNRPPTRMSTASFAGNVEQRSYPTPQGATRNEVSAGGGGSTSLPPFARNLPVDPYVGASLVQQPNRESLRNPQAATHAQTAPSGLPPGGLIGVIAGEERARALRRGSPNTQGTYDVGPVPHAQPQLANAYGNQIPMLPQHGIAGSALPLGAGDQSQSDLNNSMAQMMQMQMQWMQQMMAMYGMQPGMQMPPMPQMPQVAGNNFMPAPQFSHPNQPQHRPTSSASFYGRPTTTVSAAPSLYNLHPGGPGGGYTPSIAPSERSNVGQPSRYRPVTSAGEDYSRTSTMSQYGMQTMGQAGRSRSQSQLTVKAARPGSAHLDSVVIGEPKRSTIRAVSRPKHGPTAASEDEDDEGWAEMAKKREERKSKWRTTRNLQSSAGAPEGGLEGLYYEA